MWRQRWKDYYEILELIKNPITDERRKGPYSSPKEITQQWKKLQKQWSPDKHEQGTQDWRDANERSKLLNEAYEVLSDREKKRLYDQEWFKRNPTWREPPPPPRARLRFTREKIPFGELELNQEKEDYFSAIVVSGEVRDIREIEVSKPLSKWLKISRKDESRKITIRVVVNTAGLVAGQSEPYSEDLIFIFEGQEIGRVRVELTTKPEEIPESEEAKRERIRKAELAEKKRKAEERRKFVKDLTIAGFLISLPIMVLCVPIAIGASALLTLTDNSQGQIYEQKIQAEIRELQENPPIEVDVSRAKCKPPKNSDDPGARCITLKIANNWRGKIAVNNPDSNFEFSCHSFAVGSHGYLERECALYGSNDIFQGREIAMSITTVCLHFTFVGDDSSDPMYLRRPGVTICKPVRDLDQTE